MEKMDRRTKYTLTTIKDSMLKLMEKKEISKITVTELCNLADINRATFYKYYVDIYDLIEKIELELYNDIKKSIDLIENNESIKPFIDGMIKIIYENQNACKVLFGPYGNKEFIRKIVYLGYIKSVTEWKNKLTKFSTNQIDYIFNFFAFGSIGIIEKWIDDKFRNSPEEISKLINDLCDNLLSN